VNSVAAMIVSLALFHLAVHAVPHSRPYLVLFLIDDVALMADEGLSHVVWLRQYFGRHRVERPNEAGFCR
jgi:hypothetical protein